MTEERFKEAGQDIKVALADAAKIEPLEERAATQALCYDTKALTILALADKSPSPDQSLEQAREPLNKAIALHPFPDALLHMAQLHERSWERQPSPVERSRLFSKVVKIRDEIDHLAGDGEVAREAAAIVRRLDETNYIATSASNGGDAT